MSLYCYQMGSFPMSLCHFGLYSIYIYVNVSVYIYLCGFKVLTDESLPVRPQAYMHIFTRKQDGTSHNLVHSNWICSYFLLPHSQRVLHIDFVLFWRSLVRMGWTAQVGNWCIEFMCQCMLALSLQRYKFLTVLILIFSPVSLPW